MFLSLHVIRKRADLDLEAAGARPHRDLVHLPLVPAPRVAPAAAPLAALPVLPAFAAAAAIVAAPGAAAVWAPRVVLLPPEARPEAAAEFVHPAGPLLEVLHEKERRSGDLVEPDSIR